MDCELSEPGSELRRHAFRKRLLDEFRWSSWSACSASCDGICHRSRVVRPETVTVKRTQRTLFFWRGNAWGARYGFTEGPMADGARACGPKRWYVASTACFGMCCFEGLRETAPCHPTFGSSLPQARGHTATGLSERPFMAKLFSNLSALHAAGLWSGPRARLLVWSMGGWAKSNHDQQVLSTRSCRCNDEAVKAWKECSATCDGGEHA